MFGSRQWIVPHGYGPNFRSRATSNMVDAALAEVLECTCSSCQFQPEAYADHVHGPMSKPGSMSTVVDTLSAWNKDEAGHSSTQVASPRADVLRQGCRDREASRLKGQWKMKIAKRTQAGRAHANDALKNRQYYD